MSRRGPDVKTSQAASVFLTRRRRLIFRDWRPAKRDGSRQLKPLEEPAMNTFFDDFATTLVSLTLCLATVSMFAVVFGGAV
jgi:hypothetical protein